MQSHYIYLKNYFPFVPELSEQNKHRLKKEREKKKKKAEREEGGIVDAISGTWLVGTELEFYKREGGGIIDFFFLKKNCRMVWARRRAGSAHFYSAMGK